MKGYTLNDLGGRSGVRCDPIEILAIRSKSYHRTNLKTVI